MYVIAPIDRCYALTGAVKATWEGISGGAGVEGAVTRFFDELRRAGGAGTGGGARAMSLHEGVTNGGGPAVERAGTGVRGARRAARAPRGRADARCSTSRSPSRAAVRCT